jgi:hypothetical protein
VPTDTTWLPHRFHRIAYAYTTRKWSVSPLSSLAPGDPDHEEACCQISRLVPFLAGRKATTVHQSLTSVVTDFWSRFDTVGTCHPYSESLFNRFKDERRSFLTSTNRCCADHPASFRRCGTFANIGKLETIFGPARARHNDTGTF